MIVVHLSNLKVEHLHPHGPDLDPDDHGLAPILLPQPIPSPQLRHRHVIAPDRDEERMLKRARQREGGQRPGPIRVHLKVHHHVDLAHGGRKDGRAHPLARVMIEAKDLVAHLERLDGDGGSVAQEHLGAGDEAAFLGSADGGGAVGESGAFDGALLGGGRGELPGTDDDDVLADAGQTGGVADAVDRGWTGWIQPRATTSVVLAPTLSQPGIIRSALVPIALRWRVDAQRPRSAGLRSEDLSKSIIHRPQECLALRAPNLELPHEDPEERMVGVG